MLRKLGPTIKYGVLAAALGIALSIYFFGLWAVLGALLRGLLWLSVLSISGTVLLLAAVGLVAWQSNRAASRLSIDDPLFRAWLLDTLWFCREQGFFLGTGANLGECEEWTLEKLRRDWGGVGTPVKNQPMLLLLHDDSRIAIAPEEPTPRAAEDFVNALARISRKAFRIDKVQVAPGSPIRLEVRSEGRTVEIHWPGDDDGRAIADALSAWLEEGQSFRHADIAGTIAYAALSDEEHARLEREMGWTEQSG